MADKPVTREEKYLAYLTGDYKGELPKPITRKEKYLYELCLKGMGGEISPEEIKNAVNEYLEKNPVKPGATTEQAQQIEQNKTDIVSLKEGANSLKEDLSKLSEEIANQGGGMSTEAANLLITILRNGVYSTDQSANITALAETLEATKEEQPDTPVDPDAVTYTVTNNLTNVTTSNAAASVTKGASYSAILTAADGYELDTVTVTIGGVDVTSTVYAGGKITIAAVTGNVVITAEAVAAKSETVEVEMTTNNMVKHAELTVYSDEGTTTIDISNFNSPVPGHFSVDAFTEDTAVTITRSAMSSSTWKTLCIGECDANNDKVLYNAMRVDDGFGTDAEAKQFNYTVHAGRKLVIIRRTNSLSWFTITVTK